MMASLSQREMEEFYQSRPVLETFLMISALALLTLLVFTAAYWTPGSRLTTTVIAICAGLLGMMMCITLPKTSKRESDE